MRNKKSCRRSCERTVECNYWVFVPRSEPNRRLRNACYLLSEKELAVPNEQRVSGEVHCLEHSPGVFSCECNSTPPPGPPGPPPGGNCETVRRVAFYMICDARVECAFADRTSLLNTKKTATLKILKLYGKLTKIY